MSKEIKNSEFISAMRNGAADLMFSPLLGKKLDYSQSQLIEIEDAFIKMFKQGDKLLPTTELAFGFVLGETVIRNAPGTTWNDLDKINPFELELNLKAKEAEIKSLLRPMLRIKKMAHDHEDRMTSLYYMAVEMNHRTREESMKRGQHIGDGWYKMPEGWIYRIIQSSSDNFSLTKNISFQDKVVTLDENGQEKQLPIESLLSPTKQERTTHKN